MKHFFALFFIAQSIILNAQVVQPLSPTLEGYTYPYPVNFFALHVEGQDLKMAYMDVPPAQGNNGKTVVLMHGKNFGSFYWQQVIQWLSESGYRVIAIDQLGFGKSSRPDIHYSFNLLAANTHKLLDSLGVTQIVLVGHSTGGMLAVRYALTYPQQVAQLILEDPIGLEDYRLLFPYDSISHAYEEELHQPDSITIKYIQAYFYAWKPEYDVYAQMMNGWKRSGEYARQAKSAALTTTMIYQQPVCYEFKNIQCPALIIAGREDRTVIAKAKVPKNMLPKAGLFPQMAQSAAQQMPQGTFEIIEKCGHIPHIEQPEKFKELVLKISRQWPLKHSMDKDNIAFTAGKPASVSDHLANERTFLAWIRTGIGIMAFGFVVVKFSLFIKQLAVLLGDKVVVPQKGYSLVTGIILVGLGISTNVLAYVRYMRTKAQLNGGVYYQSELLTTLLTVVITLIGAFLLVYLVTTT